MAMNVNSSSNRHQTNRWPIVSIVVAMLGEETIIINAVVVMAIVVQQTLVSVVPAMPWKWNSIQH
jgi:hypothetical protein